MAFSQRIINLQFQLADGSFGASKGDTVLLEGLRCSVNIVKEGIGFARGDLQIWGMSLDLMNRLTVLNKVRQEQQRFNTVLISAGDEESGVATCFGGIIREAWADGRGAPDVLFHVSADSALYTTLKPVPPISFNGTVDGALVLAGIAQQMGYSLENSGVTAQLNNPYYPGTLKSQLQAVCEHVPCEYYIDDVKKVVAVWPKGKARDPEGSPVLISKDTGMISYPSFSQAGIQLSTLYNPNIEFGRAVTVESQFTSANGFWRVSSLAHRLESNVPGGQWFTDIECSFLDHPA